MNRKPLVLVDGQLSELPATDSLSMATPALPVVVMTAAQVSTAGGVVTLTADNLPSVLALPNVHCEVYLPLAADAVGRQVTLVTYKEGAITSGSIVVCVSGSDNFNGNAQRTGVALGGLNSILTVVSDGTTWRILSNGVPGDTSSVNVVDASGGDSLTLTGEDQRKTTLIDASLDNLAITLPPISTVIGRVLAFVRQDTSTNTVTITADAADSLDGVAQGSVTLGLGASINLLATWGGWLVVGKYSAAQAGGQQVYVQPNDPGLAAGVPGLWIQTGLGADGTGFTFWFNT